MEYNYPIPDIADLNDWIFDHEPALFEATRYLQPTSQYDVWYPVWEAAGRPTEGFESSLWEKEDC